MQRRPTQDTSFLIMQCPAADSLRRSLFGDSFFLYDLWSRPRGVSWLQVLHGLPLFLGRSLVATTTTLVALLGLQNKSNGNATVVHQTYVISTYACSKNENELSASIANSMRALRLFIGSKKILTLSDGQIGKHTGC